MKTLNLAQIKQEPTQSKSSTELTEEESTSSSLSISHLSKKIRVKRPSASKKYPGQIMVGVGKFIIKMLQSSHDPFERRLVDVMMREVMGKNKEDYRVNSVEKIRKFFVVEANEDFITLQLKKLFYKMLVQFFHEPFYSEWIFNEFKGNKVNKNWFIINKIPLVDRIVLNKKTHFYLDAKESPFANGDLTIDSKTYQASGEGKMKEEH